MPLPRLLLAVRVPGRLIVLACSLLTACGGGADCRPNVVLITVESLRPDHLQSFSGPRLTSPNLDALAAEGVVYTDAHAVTSWTLTSHASLFTGLYPTAHQTTEPLSTLGDSYHTLAEILTAHGYECAAVVSGPYLRREHRLDQGFEFYDDAPAGTDNASAHGDVTSTAMHEGIAKFLEQRDGERPFFLFGYYWDPHYDYIPPAPFDEAYVDADCTPIDVGNYETTTSVHAGITPNELRYVKSQYDGEIRWTDQNLGRLFKHLKDADLWDDTLVIITADHGEEFFEHGHKGHKHNLNVESVHVPLIVKYPVGGRTGVDDRLVSLIDLLPTVLEATDTGLAEPVHGRSLLGPEDPERPVYFELLSRWYLARPDGTTTIDKDELWLAVRRGDYKLQWVPAQERVELFSVSDDPGEQHNLAAEKPELAEELRALIEVWRGDMQALATGHTEGGLAELTPAMLDRLKALGYVE